MKLNKTILGLLAVTITLINCKKDDDGGFEQIIEVEETVNEAPSSTILSFPENNAELISLVPLLEWEPATDPEGKEVSYDIYLGTNENNLTLQTENSNGTTFQLETELQKGTSYFWKIIAEDDKEESSESDIYSFNTAHVKITQIIDNAPFSKRRSSSTTVFNDKIWVIGGEDESGNALSDIWNSSDGINWTQTTDNAPFGIRKSHQVMVFNNKMWIYNGSNGTHLNNEIWSTEDGSNWLKEENDSYWDILPFYGQAHTTMFIFDNKIWRLAAYYGSIEDLSIERYIWNSSDGKNWNLVSENHGFDKKYGMGVTVFQDKLIATEGYVEDGVHVTKIWQSDNGITWNLLSENLPFSIGTYGELQVQNNKLFITAGSAYNELWFSEDGVNWKKTVQEREYQKRYANSSVVLNDKIYIVGGGTHTSLYNDVWTIE